MGKKALFFDIDGTLINFDGTMLESTKQALKRAQEMGHYVFLCTGRSKVQIDDRLLAFGFDGMVAAAGAYVEYRGEAISKRYMDHEPLKRMLQYFLDHKMTFMLQCTDRVVSTRRCIEEFRIGMLQRGPVDPEIIEKIMGEQVIDDDILEHLDRYENAEKGCYHHANIPLEQVKKDLGDAYSITAMSFRDEEDFSGEIGLAGVNKAYGIQQVMQHLGIFREDTVGFGDGPNDFEMVEFAGTGVAMGNASEDLKQKADFVTKRIEEDGILYAMESLKLI